MSWRVPHAIPDIGLEHRVITHAGESDAVVLQHVGVVLEVVTELALLRIFQDRLSVPRGPACGRAAAGHPHNRVQRKIRRRARLDAEGKSDDLGAHVVEARGLGVDDDQRPPHAAREPTLEVLPAGQSLIVSLDRGAPRDRIPGGMPTAQPRGTAGCCRRGAVAARSASAPPPVPPSNWRSNAAKLVSRI